MQDFYVALNKHTDPADEYCLPLFSAFVLGSDIKPDRQAIHISLSSPCFLLNAIRALESASDSTVVHMQVLLQVDGM